MNQNNIKTCSSFMAVLIILGLSCFQTDATEEEPKLETISVGMNLPQITLDAPGSENDREYLSLKDLKPFSLHQVTAKIIVLEIFSVYCPHCRMQSPKLNKVFKLIKHNTGLSPDIKMIGIATVSDQSKTNKWKTKHHVPFPLFTDSKGDIWEKLGNPKIPLTLLITPNGKVLSTHPGVTANIEELFLDITKKHKEQ